MLHVLHLLENSPKRCPSVLSTKAFVGKGTPLIPHFLKPPKPPNPKLYIKAFSGQRRPLIPHFLNLLNPQPQTLNPQPLKPSARLRPSRSGGLKLCLLNDLCLESGEWCSRFWGSGLGVKDLR